MEIVQLDNPEMVMVVMTKEELSVIGAMAIKTPGASSRLPRVARQKGITQFPFDLGQQRRLIRAMREAIEGVLVPKVEADDDDIPF